MLKRLNFTENYDVKNIQLYYRKIYVVEFLRSILCANSLDIYLLNNIARKILRKIHK